MLDNGSVERLIELLQKNLERVDRLECLAVGQPVSKFEPEFPSAGASALGHRPGLAVPLAALMTGDPATRHFSIAYSPAGELAQAAGPGPVEAGPELVGVAAKVFQLLSALDSGNKFRRAPPIKVFLLHFRQNLSGTEVARACHCARSLVSMRLKKIRESLPWQPQQLRELSAQVEAMQEALSDPRARKIYRKGAVYGEDEEA
jgi:hypothetical protein